MKINIPNQITLGRLVLTLIFFALLSVYEVNDGNTWIFIHICFWVFLVAAITDVLDGYLARTLKQVTTFGRIVDPVVDKVMICGAFVFFASPHFYDITEGARSTNVVGVQVWMVVVLIVREFLVSAIRSHAEAQGQEFAASWTGKFKMLIQSITVCVILAQVAWFYPAGDFPRMALFRKICVWATVIITALSIVGYIRRARSFLLSSSALSISEPDPSSAPVQTTAPSSTANSSRSDRPSTTHREVG